MKIITICSADRERRRLNRFCRFCGSDCGKGAIFWWVGTGKMVGFFRVVGGKGLFLRGVGWEGGRVFLEDG